MSLEKYIKTINRDIELKNKNNLNLFLFESKLVNIKNDSNIEFHKYKEYVQYKYDDKYLMQFQNGSSISYIKNNNNNNKYEDNFIIKVIDRKKINNNLFEPKFEYSKIKKYEIIIFNFNKLLIEFIKIKSLINNNIKYQIKIKINKDFNFNKNTNININYLLNNLKLFN